MRFDGNDYSVPVRYAHHPVVVKGYVDRVVIYELQKVIARHRRLWGKAGVRFEPVHYLALLERKPGAWTMPGRWRTGNCRSASRCCAGGWKRSWMERGRGSTSACCGCWSSTRCPRSPGPLSGGCAVAA